MKVLITGGAGFLGSHLADAFLARGDEVTVLDIGSDAKVRHNLKNPRFRLVQNSIFDVEMLENLVRRCDLVYHLAAVVGVEHYVADPYHVLNVNVNGTQNILRAAHRYDRKIVIASTSEVYGRNTKVPYAENDDRVLGSTGIDRWCYSTSKAVGEHFAFAYGKLGLPIVIVRYFNVYGPRLDALDVGRVISIFAGQLLNGEPLTVVGDGSQTRCFTYVDDAVRATMAAGLKDEAVGGIFNIGTDRETSVLELAQLFLRLRNTGSTIQFVPQQSIYGESYEDVLRRVPVVDRMHDILGVQAKVSLEKGMSDTLDWFEKIRPAKRVLSVGAEHGG
ncbi:MAG: NAD-dependent epimerase/dehydratase family protein [Planctomycetota bacterium]